MNAKDVIMKIFLIVNYLYYLGFYENDIHDIVILKSDRTLKVSGTSYSAAAVSGEAAKIAAFHPKYSSAEIKRALVAGCETSRYLQSMVNDGNYLPIKHTVNANDIIYKKVR